MCKLFYFTTNDKYNYVVIQFYQLVISFRCNIVIYNMFSSVSARISMFLQVQKLSISNELPFFLNLTFFHSSWYKQILSSKKYLANFGAPARFHSISITVESGELSPSLSREFPRKPSFPKEIRLLPTTARVISSRQSHVNSSVKITAAFSDFTAFSVTFHN